MTQRIPLHDLAPEAGVGRHDPAGTPPRGRPATRTHLYVREIRGVFQRLRRRANWGLMALYLVLPWIRWGERPLVWFDLPSREFHLFSATFYPQDFILLAWLLIVCAFGLFLITVLAGRVWCGYACPQSVWTFLFIWFEHRLEGPRHRRMRRDRAPRRFDTLWRKAVKHGAWLTIAFITGLTFVGYFTPIRDLVSDLATLEMGPWALFWIGFFTLFTYLNAGWLREQVCLHMCPYARFQSVMFDPNTLIVSYDAARGEPRRDRRHKAGGQSVPTGDCIDCEQCVQVCPTGIDIRDGLQYECIGCAACIDACDDVMERIGKPRGLVRYTTERALAGKASHILRPQLVGYAIGLAVMIALIVAFMVERTPLQFEIERDRQRLFTQVAEGRVVNHYTLTLRNQDDRAHRFHLAATGLPALSLIGPEVMAVEANSTQRWRVALEAAPEALSRPSHPVTLRVVAAGDGALAIERETRFLGPSDPH
ncbi:cytochrome c oxidase accessory protein CcoG [Halomonas icarae]|uniref:Cytochrome c oxidase accessory protein CcoG n=1 Tax=Halomonas icarae TaxID=2691040 RepID=A0A7X4VW53_9GAMM|nr:cytochrome c oxidase accessory protein CcoG [Halomonas icarae]MDR5901127.1 cytochrome c oxidase accessory protein CcoG [Halomonas icarae]NAW11404.1 cytochrome c oxidase accessory protein CcoG [Halomonas icarae]